jgi:predicted AlkP superfamily pyrophosphatase or phosphodiesterase
MINKKSLKAVDQSIFHEKWRAPLYSSYCFSRLPETIKSLFVKNSYQRLPRDTTFDGIYDHVILFIVDGFGWRFFDHYLPRSPFLKRIVDDGIASKLTAQFPSTTAAHVTCANTGLSVAESGVFEWFYYEPKLDRVITPLLFSFAGDKQINTLKKTKIKPTDLYPSQTLYQALQKEDIVSYVLQHESICHSPYSQVMFQGAHPIPFSHLEEALIKLKDLQRSIRDKRAYFYVYHGDIDSAGHRKGIFSEPFEAAVREWQRIMDAYVQEMKKETKAKTACLVIADHGMTVVDPKTTFYLNLEIPECTTWIKRNKEGRLIVPGGSCRDFFLYIKPESLTEAMRVLKERLKGRALVFSIEELIEEGLFGTGRLSPTFLKRVGNVVLLPFEGESIWWYEKNRFEQHFYAMHGGLTPHEMEIPFLFFEL